MALRLVLGWLLAFAGVPLAWAYAAWLRRHRLTADNFRQQPLLALGPLLGAVLLAMLALALASGTRLRLLVAPLLVTAAPQLLVEGARALSLAWWTFAVRFRGRALWSLSGISCACMFLALTALQTALLMPVAGWLPPGRCDPAGVVLQTSPVTCVPSAVATVARLHGAPLDERTATARAGTCCLGSFIYEMLAGVRRIGFPAAEVASASFEQLLAEDRPFLVCGDVFRGGVTIMHAQAVIGVAGDEVAVADPLVGLRRLPRARFAAGPGRFFVRLGPPAFAAVRQPSLRRFSPADLAAASLADGG